MFRTPSAITLKQKKYKRLNVLVFLLFIISSGAYLIGVNEYSIKQLEVQQKKRQAKAIKSEINQLEVQAMALSSLNSLSPRVDNLKMVKVDTMEYLDVKPVVALR
ncbi:MAG: hypothetical protein WCK11_05145 [Candidatus Falkowbacteria bacterium]